MPVMTARPSIRAEIVGSDTCAALGITTTGHAPVLALCRKLVDAGVDPVTPLEAWRGDVLCLKVRSIAQGAALEVRPASGGTPVFIRRESARRASPMRQTGGAATGVPPPRLFTVAGSP
jgi:hypothetical protein